MSYSQIGQDLAVLEFYNHKTDGYFIEIGASNGIVFSNTYLLETKYNWKGICAEPIPKQFKELIKNRPNSICSDKALYNKSELTIQFDIAGGCDLISGISEHVTGKWKTKVDSNKITIDVETITLNDLLDSANAPTFIDYLSLDTEGTELEILKSVDFNKYKFGLIDVEHNHIEPKRTEIKEYLLSNGYVYLRQNKWDDCYKHSSL